MSQDFRLALWAPEASATRSSVQTVFARIALPKREPHPQQSPCRNQDLGCRAYCVLSLQRFDIGEAQFDAPVNLIVVFEDQATKRCQEGSRTRSPVRWKCSVRAAISFTLFPVLGARSAARGWWKSDRRVELNGPALTEVALLTISCHVSCEVDVLQERGVNLIGC
jgi:hypothetical protein